MSTEYWWDEIDRGQLKYWWNDTDRGQLKYLEKIPALHYHSTELKSVELTIAS
jgi:hypothetical protein